MHAHLTKRLLGRASEIEYFRTLVISIVLVKFLNSGSIMALSMKQNWKALTECRPPTSRHLEFWRKRGDEARTAAAGVQSRTLDLLRVVDENICFVEAPTTRGFPSSQTEPTTLTATDLVAEYPTSDTMYYVYVASPANDWYVG